MIVTMPTTSGPGGIGASRGGWPRIAVPLAVVLGLVIVNVPELGSDPWDFRPGTPHVHGAFSPLVRAAHGRWDVGIMRASALLGGLVAVLAIALIPLLERRRARLVATVATGLACAALVLPAAALQAGLRQSTAPWFYTNDATYQAEIAGDLVDHGDLPYGHDFSRDGLARFYSLDGSLTPASLDHVALRHFPYFPGTVVLAGAWRLLPAPLDDYRVLMALATLALLPAALLFPGPLWWRLSLGAVLSANPLVVRAAWFGTVDGACLLALTLAFGLASRRRYGSCAAALACAVLLKQFALVAVPFLAIVVAAGGGRAGLRRAAVIFAAILAAGLVPFAAAGPHAFWDDTIAYGTQSYRIVGYGLAGLLLRAHVLHDRSGSYPFLALAVVLWLPLTAWLCVIARRRGDVATAAFGFALSMFLILYLARVFQVSHLAYPLTGLVCAALALPPPVPSRQILEGGAGVPRGP